MNTTSQFTVPSEIAVFFKKLPILIIENPREYEAVFAGLVTAIEPKNAFEWLLLKDIVELSWEIRRSAVSKAATINMKWKESLQLLLESLLEVGDEERRHVAQERAEQWFTSSEARASLLGLLHKYQLGEDAIVAQAIALASPEIEMLDRKIERARVSRMVLLRDIEHHRAAGTWKVAKDLLQIVDAASEAVTLAPSTDHSAHAP